MSDFIIFGLPHVRYPRLMRVVCRLIGHRKFQDRVCLRCGTHWISWLR